MSSNAADLSASAPVASPTAPETSPAIEDSPSERAPSPTGSNQRSTATVEITPAATPTPNGPQVSVSVDSDLVTANAEILRSQLQESFNIIETSPAVFAHPRSLVPYFFGRPDPHQRSYASSGDYSYSKYSYATSTTATTGERSRAGEGESAPRKVRRNAPSRPSPEELSAIRAHNPELYMRMAYGNVFDMDALSKEERELLNPDGEPWLEVSTEDMYRTTGGSIAVDGVGNINDSERRRGDYVGANSGFSTGAHQASQLHGAGAAHGHAHAKSASSRSQPAVPTVPFYSQGAKAFSSGSKPAASTRQLREHPTKRVRHATDAGYWSTNSGSTSAASTAPSGTSSASHRVHPKGSTSSSTGAPGAGAKGKSGVSSSAYSHWNGSTSHSRDSSAGGAASSLPKPPAGKEKEMNEERVKVHEFWRSLPEEQRNSLIKLEKEAILKKMKEQQKHTTCACELCGKRRTAIEEELEMLYDAYYQELERYTGKPGDPVFDFFKIGASASSSNAATNASSPSSTSVASSGTSTPTDPSNSSSHHHHHHGQHRKGASNDLNLGSLSSSASLLHVADDFLKNDGKKFIAMMEELADARLRRERLEEAAGTSSSRQTSASASSTGAPASTTSAAQQQGIAAATNANCALPPPPAVHHDHGHHHHHHHSRSSPTHHHAAATASIRRPHHHQGKYSTSARNVASGLSYRRQSRQHASAASQHNAAGHPQQQQQYHLQQHQDSQQQQHQTQHSEEEYVYVNDLDPQHHHPHHPQHPDDAVDYYNDGSVPAGEELAESDVAEEDMDSIDRLILSQIRRRNKIDSRRATGVAANRRRRRNENGGRLARVGGDSDELAIVDDNEEEDIDVDVDVDDGEEYDEVDVDHDDEEEVDEEDDEDDYDDDEEEDDEEDEEDDEEDDDEDAMMNEEQRIEEGKHMLQMFAAKMFEQRILAAYREKVTREQQERLIAEEEERLKQEQAKKDAKQKKKEREKLKKQQKHQEEIEERKRKEKEEEEKQRQHRLEVERQAREREAKKREDRLREEEERLKQLAQQEAKRKADQERKKAEKAAKAQAKQEEQQKLEKERLEKERVANALALEKQRAADKAKADAEAALAKAKEEADAKAKADSEAAMAKAAAAEKAKKAANPDSSSTSATGPAPTSAGAKKTQATNVPGATKKKAPKQPLLPLEPPKEPPSAMPKKALVKEPAKAPVSTATGANATQSHGATHAAPPKTAPPGGAKKSSVTPTSVPGSQPAHPGPSTAARNAHGQAPNAHAPRTNTHAGGDAQGRRNNAPDFDSQFPAISRGTGPHSSHPHAQQQQQQRGPSPPLDTAFGAPSSHHAQNNKTPSSLSAVPSYFSSAPLLTSQELAAPVVTNAWDALAAGLDRGFGGVPSAQHNSGGNSLSASTGISSLMMGSLGGGASFASLAGIGGDSADPIAPFGNVVGGGGGLGVSSSSSLNNGGNSLFQTLLTGPSGSSGTSSGGSGILSGSLPGFGSHPLQTQSTHQQHLLQPQQQQPSSMLSASTGLKGLLSVDDEVVHGHTLAQLPNTASAPSGPTTTSSFYAHTEPSQQTAPLPLTQTTPGMLGFPGGASSFPGTSFPSLFNPMDGFSTTPLMGSGDNEPAWTTYGLPGSGFSSPYDSVYDVSGVPSWASSPLDASGGATNTSSSANFGLSPFSNAYGSTHAQSSFGSFQPLLTTPQTSAPQPGVYNLFSQ